MFVWTFSLEMSAITWRNIDLFATRHPCVSLFGRVKGSKTRRKNGWFWQALYSRFRYKQCGRQRFYSATISSHLTFSGSRLTADTASPCLPIVVTTHPLTGCIPPSFPSPFVPSDYGGWTTGGENMGHGCFYVNTHLLSRKFDCTLLNLWSSRESNRIHVIRKRERDENISIFYNNKNMCLLNKYLNKQIK